MMTRQDRQERLIRTVNLLKDEELALAAKVLEEILEAERKLPPQERMREAIKRTLAKRGEMTRREIKQYANTAKYMGEFDEVFSPMVENGDVVSRPRGKTAVYFLKERSDN
jgi:hypothetical protein